jgi:hypothetical protein
MVSMVCVHNSTSKEWSIWCFSIKSSVMKTDATLSDSNDISSCRHSWQDNQGLQEIIVKVCDLRTLWHTKYLHMHNKWELYTEKEMLAIRNTSATCCLHLWYLNGPSVVDWMGSMHVYYSENSGFKSTSV